jgi:hypothetical protein
MGMETDSLLRRKFALFNYRSARGNAQWSVDCQYLNSCPPDRRAAGKNRTSPDKMFLPMVLPRMKERGQFARIRIQAGNVGALESIATAAGQRHIIQCGSPAMLPGDDMVQNVRQPQDVFGNLAIFAPILCSTTNLCLTCRHILTRPACGVYLMIGELLTVRSPARHWR